jgi:hypothetical protein
LLSGHRFAGFETRSPDSLDGILAETPIPRDFDLLSIDMER